MEGRRTTSGKWFGVKPKKEGWHDHRNEFRLQNCEHCQTEVLHLQKATREGGDVTLVKYEGVVDHIVPERLILKLTDKPPHFARNLMCLAKSCHGIKTAADRLLCKGDVLGFLQLLREHNWPMERVESALRFYGFSK